MSTASEEYVQFSGKTSNKILNSDEQKEMDKKYLDREQITQRFIISMGKR